MARGTRDWTDAGEHDPGITLVELLAFVAEELASYQDELAAEARRRTRRRWGLAIAALVGAICFRRWWRPGGADEPTQTSRTFH